MQSLSTSTRWLIAVAIAIVAATVLAVVVALAAGGEQTFPPGSPEHAVQSYLKAVADRDASAALDFISPALFEECDISREPVTRRTNSRFRATLDDTVQREDHVEVHVTISESHGDPPFDGGESNWPAVLELSQENGAWRFVEVPWPLYCAPKAERVPTVPAR